MKVSISVTRETKYCTIVEMTEEEFDTYSKRLYENEDSKDERACAEELNEMIDVHDWQDDELDPHSVEIGPC